MSAEARHLAGVLLAAAVLLGSAQAQAPTTTVVFDATAAPAEAPKPLSQFSGKSPNGHEIGANSQYLTFDGRPWFPVMGEFHFARFPEKDWETEILKMKAGGVDIVATYVFWIHQEEVEGQFDWSGRRNLRHFVELCQKHGMFVFLRIGPWAHGEARNGGFPDWLLKKSPETRKNDPVYLGYVRRFYDEIGKQIQGLTWGDGGPIVGVQLENEYVRRGPGAGAAHILELKKLAQQAGITAPLWTVTGWMNPEVPGEATLPVFAGYPDAFWDASRTELPPNPNFFFTTLRDDGGVGTDLLPKHPTSEAEFSRYPYLVAEGGGGMELAYHRRPLIAPSDIAAMVISKIGSGANMYGYYMFHGGTNPDGKLTTLQESQATGYWNDLPVKSYDFQAPLGEFGQMHPSFRPLKLLHYFLNNFGSLLAPMRPVFPESKPKGLDDRETLRSALRVSGDSGFLFVNNYERTYPLADHPAVRFNVKLPGGALSFPKAAVPIASGAYFIWPVNMRLGGAVLKYATAQPLLTLESGGEAYYFFFATAGIAPEFAFDGDSVLSVKAGTGEVTRSEGQWIASGIRPGTGVALTVESRDRRLVRIVILSEEEAENAWTAQVGGERRIVSTPADFFTDGTKVSLRSRRPGDLRFGIFPGLEAAPSATAPLRRASADGLFETYAADVTPVKVAVKWAEVRRPKPVPPVRVKRVAEAPEDSTWTDSGVWDISIPKHSFQNLSDVFLDIRYAGDVARLYRGNELVTDDFYKGTPFEIGLQRVSPELAADDLRVEVLPLRKDAPIYLPTNAWPAFPPGGQVCEVRSITAIPEYKMSITVGSPSPPGRTP